MFTFCSVDKGKDECVAPRPGTQALPVLQLGFILFFVIPKVHLPAFGPLQRVLLFLGVCLASYIHSEF